MYCGKYSPVLVPVILIQGGIRNIKSICMKEYFMHLFSKKMYAISFYLPCLYARGIGLPLDFDKLLQ